MKPLKLAILLFCIVTQKVSSQNLINVGFKPPEVASLDKFVNVPVSYSTGVPNINIPIFEVKAGDIVLPISLDYHAGGIRVDELSSGVGTGWALNAGGSVSRSMVGLPDEYGYLNSPDFNTAYNNQSQYYQYFYDCVNGANETSPDVFFYSLIGQSGRFIIKKSDRSFIQFPLSNNKIQQNGNTYIITDQKGIQYVFDHRDVSSSGSTNSPNYTTAWRLTQIISSTKSDTITFQYESTNITQRSKSFSHTLGTDGNGALINEDGYNNVGITMSESYVKEIDWKGGRVTFTNSNDRLDVAGGKRITQINLFSKVNSAYSLLKSIALIQSYFYYKPTGYSDPTDVSGVDPYRLRLDTVKFLDSGSSKVDFYAMTYDNTPMAPKESQGQDVWGFNNGHFENTTLMPAHNEYYVSDQVAGYYKFGSANRTTDETYMKACTIQSMIYPTGGKTVYQFEPHQYQATVTSNVTGDVSSISQGGFRSSSSTTFTLTADMTGLQYRYFISKFSGYNDLTGRPVCTLVDQTTGATILTLNSPDPTTDYTSPLVAIPGPTGPFLTVGHTYVLNTNIYTNNSNIKASVDILYNTQQTSTQNLKGGGLRVSAISNYDQNGSLINTKVYNYGADGTGVLLTPPSYLELTSESVYYKATGFQGTDNTCFVHATTRPSYIFRANSVVPVSQFSGSPIIYYAVTEYDSANSSLANGKKVFTYSTFTDNSAIASQNAIHGVELISNSWRNGYLTGESTFKSNGSNYKLIEWKQHIYSNQRASEEQMLRVRRKSIYSGPCGVSSANNLFNDLYIDSYMLPTCAILLQSDTTRTYDDTGNNVVAVSSYIYNDQTHILPTSKQTIDSKQIAINETMQYPHDFAASGNVYQTMLDRNIIAPVIQSTVQKNNNIVSINKVNYTDWFSNGNVLLPSSAQVQIGSNALETRVNFSAYDISGNIQQQSLTGGAPTTYLWSYNNQYPVVEVKNADLASVNNALTSLSMSAASIGTMSTITLAQLSQIRTAIQNALPNAQVTTYTYQPLVGMASATDAKGMTTYYEYDSFQRLMNVKDKDGNILKHTDYHYQNQ